VSDAHTIYLFPSLTFSRPDWKQLSFSCSRAGAVLSLPLPARSQDTLALGEFRKWIITHIDLWYAFTRRLGLGITRMEDIVLVTGFHLAKSFANIAFSDSRGEEQVSFEVKVPDVSRVEWRFPFEDVQGAALNVGPSGQVCFRCFPVSTSMSTQKVLTKPNLIRIYLNIIVYLSEGIVLLGFWGYFQGYGERQNQLRI
jgi:hypothetical protein